MATFKEKFFSVFHIIVFIVLQIVAFVLIDKSMNYSSAVISKTTTAVAAPVYNAWSYLWRPFVLRGENEELIQQNLQILNRVNNTYFTINDSLIQVLDTLAQPMYSYDYARVVYNSVHRKNNYIIIDKGLKDGITADMAVLSPSGVVGVVSEATENFATVLPLLHPRSSISAKVLPSNQVGAVVWKGDDPEEGNLLDIPQHVKITQGDSIITSGYSAIFPQDILIGTVKETVHEENKTFQTITLDFAANFNQLNFVYVVKNMYKNELDSLKTTFENE